MKLKFLKSGYDGNKIIPDSLINDMMSFGQSFTASNFCIFHDDTEKKYIYLLNYDKWNRYRKADDIRFSSSDNLNNTKRTSLSTILLSNINNPTYDVGNQSLFFGDMKVEILDKATPIITTESINYGNKYIFKSSNSSLTTNDFFKFDTDLSTTFIPSNSNISLYIQPKMEFKNTLPVNCGSVSALFKLHKIHNDQVVAPVIFKLSNMFNITYDSRILSLIKYDGRRMISFNLSSNGIDLTDGKYHYITFSSTDKYILMFIDTLNPSYMSLQKYTDGSERSQYVQLPQIANHTGNSFQDFIIAPQEYNVECPFIYSSYNQIMYDEHVNAFRDLLYGCVESRSL